MNLAELKKSGKLRAIPVDRHQIESLVSVAKRDLGVAGYLLKNNLDWSYIASYNSMLQMSRALMFSYGYTTSEGEHHKLAVEFVESVLGESELTTLLDRMRRKRHEVTYDEAGAVSEYEAAHALETAKRYLEEVEKKIKKRLK
ncbi:MAG: HEPN domain-containing protein [Candidatus Micrarchaeota archaeon]